MLFMVTSVEHSTFFRHAFISLCIHKHIHIDIFGISGGVLCLNLNLSLLLLPHAYHLQLLSSLFCNLYSVFLSTFLCYIRRTQGGISWAMMNVGTCIRCLWCRNWFKHVSLINRLYYISQGNCVYILFYSLCDKGDHGKVCLVANLKRLKDYCNH